MVDQAKSEFVYRATLIKRGWTVGMIRRYLGDPDKLANNPHHMSGPRAQLYNLARVEAAEKAPMIQARLKKRPSPEEYAQIEKAKLAELLGEHG